MDYMLKSHICGIKWGTVDAYGISAISHYIYVYITKCSKKKIQLKVSLDHWDAVEYR